LEHVDATAKATYALTVGRALLPGLIAEPAGHALAIAALTDVGSWLAGGCVPARVLTDHLIDETEHGLLDLDRPATEPVLRSAWMALATAVAYVAWQAWRAEGELPDPLLAEVDDDTLDLLTDQAVDAGLAADRLRAVRDRIESSAPNLPTVAELSTLAGAG
jgi:hypothetical protein